jgi:hypothetical protein
METDYKIGRRTIKWSNSHKVEAQNQREEK